MLIVGFNGSPRSNGLTIQLVNSALEGAREAGAEIQRVDLIDYDIKPWPHSARQRFEELNKLASEADGLVLGSPVYYKDVSGLMREFIDYLHSVRSVSSTPGKPGFGLAVAGGSGMGQINALGILYGFFFFRGFRPMDPIPVSRFNFRQALIAARERGAEIVGAAANPVPFSGVADKLTHYHGLDYLGYDLVDEFLLLVGQMLDSAPGDAQGIEEHRANYKLARGLVSQGKKQEAIAPAAAIYDRLWHRRAP